eukprot:910430-Pelagomonas_calceolata.AAC.1
MKDWREITYTDGSVLQCLQNRKGHSPPSQHLQLHVKSNSRGPTNTFNRSELAGILVAFQQGQTDIRRPSRDYRL